MVGHAFFASDGALEHVIGECVADAADWRVSAVMRAVHMRARAGHGACMHAKAADAVDIIGINAAHRDDLLLYDDYNDIISESVCKSEIFVLTNGRDACII